MLFMGIDVGTQGVRCVVCDGRGEIAAARSVPFGRLNIAAEPGWYEQSPGDWARAAEEAIAACLDALRAAGIHSDAIRALSVDGTSGTILALDRSGEPLTQGIMYNDPRASEQVPPVRRALSGQEARLGYRFGSSYSLPRILWIRARQPEIFERAALFVHQADYISGLLSGDFAVSDYSNALKTGYDLIENRWPEAFEAALGIAPDRLPRVARPGEPCGRAVGPMARRLGLSPDTLITGGSTDGYASALAAGAVREGSWASIIGTTFVLKGVTRDLVIDPTGACYSHKLPSGEWLLGGAGNIGGRALNACANGADFAALDAASEALIPTGARCYPLTGRGERFPFVDPAFEAFYVGDILGGRLYPAIMEGVGFAERLAFERVEALGCAVGDEICATGGACRSPLWLRIRASILNRRLKVPAVVDAAMGSALLAASCEAGSLADAADAMIRYDRIVDPDPALAARYGELYGQFRLDLKKHLGTEA